jgi:hypothetical protein
VYNARLNANAIAAAAAAATIGHRNDVSYNDGILFACRPALRA